MKKIACIIVLCLSYAACQSSTDAGETNNVQEKNITDSTLSKGPNGIVRSIIQARNGMIYIAAFTGVYSYDGKEFTKITQGVSTGRFFSAMEDRSGALWFGSVGDGVYRFDGTSFRQYTIRDGLINNEILCIYEDRAGHIWFGANGGVSRYDGEQFQNFSLTGDEMYEMNAPTFLGEEAFGKKAGRKILEVNAILEDQSGKFWFGTRGSTFIYDGNSFSTFKYGDKELINVRSIIEDATGRIWLAGSSGLLYFDGEGISSLISVFAGCVYEDRAGNIWATTQQATSDLLHYDKSVIEDGLVDDIRKTIPDTVYTTDMIFGLMEANDEGIWFGTLDGVFRLYGGRVDDFKQRQR